MDAQALQFHGEFQTMIVYITSDFLKEVLMAALVNFISKRVIYRFDVNNVFGYVGLCS